MTEEVLFNAEGKIVMVLGMKVACEPTDLKILVNGQDITKTIVLENVKITFEKKAKSQ